MSVRNSLVLLLAAVLGSGVATVAAQQRYEPGRLDVSAGYPPDLPAEAWATWQDVPAFVSFADGYVELDRAGRPSRDIENVPLAVGDRLRTTRGRAEVLFDDGSVLALDEHTTLTFVGSAEAELGTGRVRLQWRSRSNDFVISTMAGQALTRSSGDFRITLATSRRGDAELEVASDRGQIELANHLGRTLVRERTRALTTAMYAPSVPYAYSSPRDEFERWTDGLEVDRYGIESARYLPDDLRYYGGVFDRYGSWQRHPGYGYVWYPRVSRGWRPYDGGRWSFVVGFGYSWVGGSRWAWPTHHYGRWDCIGTTWFWVPASPERHRFVGYAVPRRSYTTPAAYYPRPGRADTFEVRGFSGTQTPSTRPDASIGRAVPRSARDLELSAGNSPRSGNERAVLRRVPDNTGRPLDSSPGPSTRSPGDRAVLREAPGGDPRSMGTREQPMRRAPESRPAPASRDRQREEPSQVTPPERPSSPSRAAPTPRSERPAPSRAEPERSSPPPRASAPPSDSRSPSRSGGASTGAARRRGGGGSL